MPKYPSKNATDGWKSENEMHLSPLYCDTATGDLQQLIQALLTVLQNGEVAVHKTEEKLKIKVKIDKYWS